MNQQERAVLAALNILFNIIALVLVILLGFKLGWVALGVTVIIVVAKIHAYRCYITAKFGIKDL